MEEHRPKKPSEQASFVAQEPGHCFACYRLMRPRQIYYLTLEHEVLCADCALDDAPRSGRHTCERGPPR